MRRFAVTIASLWAAVASGASAQADELNPTQSMAGPANVFRAPAPAPLPVEHTWYGWQIMLADAAVLACAVVTDQGVCLVGYPLSGLAVHNLHKNPKRGLASMVMRIGLPLAGAGIGMAAANCPPRGSNTGDAFAFDFCGLDSGIIGLEAGVAAAMIADYAMALSDTRPEPTPESNRTTGFAITPRLAVGQNNLAMGLSGTF